LNGWGDGLRSDAGNGTRSRLRRYPRVLHRRHLRGIFVMKTSVALLAVAMLTLAAGSAEAKGCIKGAVVGGVAGHYAGHHGLLGAAAGCVYGRHEANKRDQQQPQQTQGQGQAPADPNKL
jgi:hypothetical protein